MKRMVTRPVVAVVVTGAVFAAALSAALAATNGSGSTPAAAAGERMEKDSEGAPYDDGTSGGDKAETRFRQAERTPTSGRCPCAPAPGRTTAAR